MNYYDALTKWMAFEMFFSTCNDNTDMYDRLTLLLLCWMMTKESGTIIIFFWAVVQRRLSIMSFTRVSSITHFIFNVWHSASRVAFSPGMQTLAFRLFFFCSNCARMVSVVSLASCISAFDTGLPVLCCATDVGEKNRSWCKSQELKTPDDGTSTGQITRHVQDHSN